LQRIVEILEVVRTGAGSVDAVRKEDHRFPSLNALKPLIDHQIHGLVKTCPGLYLCTSDSSVGPLPVVCCLTQHMDVVVEGDVHALALRPQLVDKGGCCGLDLRDLEVRRIAHVQYKGNGEGLFLIIEILYVLPNSILEQIEVVLGQAGDKTAPPIENANRHCDQLRVYLDNTAFAFTG